MNLLNHTHYQPTAKMLTAKRMEKPPLFTFNDPTNVKKEVFDSLDYTNAFEISIEWSKNWSKGKYIVSSEQGIDFAC